MKNRLLINCRFRYFAMDDSEMLRPYTKENYALIIKVGDNETNLEPIIKAALIELNFVYKQYQPIILGFSAQVID